MLSDEDRDFQRMAAVFTGNTVGELRTRIATGFLDCARKHWGEEIPHWDGRLARVHITPEEIQAIEFLGKASYESVVDGLVSLWSEDIREKTLGEVDTQAYEKYMSDLDRESGQEPPIDWWP
jgi:hypothetical protein